jgi:hypothetical protein
MIFLLYSNNIIGYDLKSVQSTYTYPTVVESYLDLILQHIRQPTVVKSYLFTIPKSYFSPSISPMSTPFGGIVFILLTGFVGSSSGTSDPETTLDEFAVGSSDSESSENSTANSNQKQQNKDSTEGSEPIAYGYTRQSQTDEADKETDSNSIRSQKKNINQTGSEHDYQIAEIFVDKDESGFSFDREGFKDLEEQLEKEPAPVILDRINRLGRNALETIYVAAHIHYHHDVPIITDMYGEYELHKSDDQIQLVIKAIAAGEAVKDRIRAAWDAIYTLFEDDKKWYSWFDKIPVGYEIPEGETWIHPHSSGSEVVSAIMADLCTTKSYAQTLQLLDKASTNQTLTGEETRSALAELDGEKINDVFAASDYEIENFATGQLRRMVRHHLYRGKVRYPRSAKQENQTEIEEENLVLVEEELFQNVNAVVEEIADRSTPDTEDSVDVAKLSKMGILLQAVDVIDNFSPVCPECNRGMVKNRRTTLNDGSEAHYWICPKYKEEDSSADAQRKVPYENEWDALRKHCNDEYGGSDVVLLEVCRFD